MKKITLEGYFWADWDEVYFTKNKEQKLRDHKCLFTILEENDLVEVNNRDDCLSKKVKVTIEGTRDG